MNESIRTYKDLLKEEERLTALLSAQKELLQYDLKLLKEQARPTLHAFGLIGKLFTKDRSAGLIGVGTNTLIELVVGRGLLKKADWVTKFMVPFFLKNATSHVIASTKKSTWLKKALSLFKKNNHDGRHAPGPEAPPERHQPGTNGTGK